MKISIDVPNVHAYELDGLSSDHKVEVGALAHTKKNPPSFVADERTWKKAKALVQPHWRKYDEPWAVVTHVYRMMGGAFR